MNAIIATVRILYRRLRYGTTDPDRIACIRAGHEWERQDDETTYHVPKGAPEGAASGLPPERTVLDDTRVAGDLTLADDSGGPTPPEEPLAGTPRPGLTDTTTVASSASPVGRPRTYTIPETHRYQCTRCGATKTRTYP